jgi:hypothetical protein
MYVYSQQSEHKLEIKFVAVKATEYSLIKGLKCADRNEKKWTMLIKKPTLVQQKVDLQSALCLPSSMRD